MLDVGDEHAVALAELPGLRSRSGTSAPGTATGPWCRARASSPGPSGRASTRCTMFSVEVVLGRGDEPLHAVEVPACRRAARTARVRPAPTSEPASGSVSTIVAPQPRSIISSAQWRCSAVPRWWITAAKLGPARYRKAAGFAAEHQLGRRPLHGGRHAVARRARAAGPSRHHSPSQSDPVGLAERVRQGDRSGGRVEHRRVPVGVGEPRGERPGGHPVQLAEQVAGGVAVQLVERRGGPSRPAPGGPRTGRTRGRAGCSGSVPSARLPLVERTRCYSSVTQHITRG